MALFSRSRTIAPTLCGLIMVGGFVHSTWANPKEFLKEAVHALANNTSITVPAAGVLEVAFSPNEGSEHLVIKAIASAQTEINVLAYSFTSEPITRALLDARHRGVAVNMVIDEKSNISEDRSGKARAALSALATAGARVGVISAYPIHHDNRNLT